MKEDRDQRLIAMIAGQFEAMQAYMDRRFDGLERRVESMHVEFTENFTSVDERFRSVEKRLDLLTDKVTSVDRRSTNMEEEMVALNGRFDSLSDEMRQRFRVVNERLSERSKLN